MRKNTYTDIDLLKTGEKIKNAIYDAGYSVRDIQEYLKLSCPQPIYRWFKGQILPTVGNLFLLSKLLNVHMEELLAVCEESVCDGNIYLYDVDGNNIYDALQRLLPYYRFFIQFTCK